MGRSRDDGCCPLPAVAENGAMSEPKRKRRRFQFRLRTLMIGVTLFALIPCGYVGWQAKIVRERRSWLTRLQEEGYQYPKIGDIVIHAGNGHGGPNIVRRWLGDEAIVAVPLPATVSKEDRETTLQLFPESNVTQTPVAPERPATEP
jgi:hypothetical protein